MVDSNIAPSSYADQVIDWLVELGYTHCFFVAGGNIMHFLNGARSRLICVPVVHEVAAGIAAEYFNATRREGAGRAFALVTAGPGVTNILTAMGGAFLESRELLVIAGQVKSTDLASGGIRQRGIQEIDGMALAVPVCVASLQLRRPEPFGVIRDVVERTHHGRHGPGFIEFCLDVQAARALPDDDPHVPYAVQLPEPSPEDIDDVIDRLGRASRPVFLIGGGCSRDVVDAYRRFFQEFGVPILTSWNALDRFDYEDPIYFGRPDTWGMRWANAFMQQADLLIGVGARLGLQQTGFNWQAFVPEGDVVHVDVDEAELVKGHPAVARKIHSDAAAFLGALAERVAQRWPDQRERATSWESWRAFGRDLQRLLPLDDPENATAPGYISPYRFVDALSDFMTADDILIPCSSGGASTVLMQAFRQRLGQICVNNKALASMGYGLSGAIGASLAHPDRRVFMVEGDGGFAQNMQELGTIAAQALNVKIFLYVNNGYASIRMTQRNYFGGAYVGCDAATGLGLPDWEVLATSFGIPCRTLSVGAPFGGDVDDVLESDGPAMVLVPLDPEQTYFPKISSRVTSTGSMESNPLHRMSPDLPSDVEVEVLRYLGSETEPTA